MNQYAPFVPPNVPAGTGQPTFWTHPPGQPNAAPPPNGDWVEWVFVKDKGWTHERDLKPGDQVRQKGGGWETVPENVVIEVTEEHPFFVQGKGWTPLRDIRPSDLLRTENGWVPVNSIECTGRVETVYNLAVEGDHTYFVGKPEWGFSVWAHNSCSLTDHRLQAEGRTLLVGEGDFSFAVSLARGGKLDPRKHTLVASDLTEGGYRGAAVDQIAFARESNIKWLRDNGFAVHENVNALKLSEHFASGSLDNIIWMGPWSGKAAGQGSRGAQQRAIVALREELITPFLKGAEPLLRPEGRVYLAWQQTTTSNGVMRSTGLHNRLALRELFNDGQPLAGQLKLGGVAEFVPAVDYPFYRPISNWSGTRFSAQEKWTMYAIKRANDATDVFPPPRVPGS